VTSSSSKKTIEESTELFLVDKEQIKKHYETVNPKNKNHKFQGFLKNDKPTRYIDIKNTDHLIRLCEKYTPKGILCISVNPTKPKVMNSCSITEITNIIIDIDVKKERKQKGVSTEEDKKAAYEITCIIKKKLEEEINLKVSLILDSGNGYHIYIPVCVSLDGFFTGKNKNENEKIWKESTIRGKLVYLENVVEPFANDVVNIDCITKDIARRAKIAGTWNVKPEISEKDYRMATIVELHQDALEDISIESNNTVLNAFEPVMEETQEDDEEISVDDTVDLYEILKKDMKVKQLFEGDLKGKYKSRSEAEFALVVILLSKGMSEKKVRLALSKAKIGKWKGSPKQYKDITIKNAKKYAKKILKGRTEWESDNIEEKINININLKDVLKLYGFKGFLSKNGDEYSGDHPLHGTKGGSKFNINLKKGVWKCISHGSGGGPLELIAVLEGIIDCSDAYKDVLFGEKYEKTLQIAKEKYGLKTDIDDEKEVIATITIGNTTVELLNPKNAWKEIKCYEMNDGFVLQPIRHPLKISYDVEDKDGNITKKQIKKMGFVLLCQHRDGAREIIYPRNKGIFSLSTFLINGSEYQIPSEPMKMNSLPKNILQRFLNGEQVDGREIWKNIGKHIWMLAMIKENTQSKLLGTYLLIFL